MKANLLLILIPETIDLLMHLTKWIGWALNNCLRCNLALLCLWLIGFSSILLGWNCILFHFMYFISFWVFKFSFYSILNLFTPDMDDKNIHFDILFTNVLGKSLDAPFILFWAYSIFISFYWLLFLCNKWDSDQSDLDLVIQFNLSSGLHDNVFSQYFKYNVQDVCYQKNKKILKILCWSHSRCEILYVNKEVVRIRFFAMDLTRLPRLKASGGHTIWQLVIMFL